MTRVLPLAPAVAVAALAINVTTATATDCNGNGVPDELDVVPGVFSLAPPATYAAGIGPRALAAADLDGDGLVDLAAASGGSGDISIYLNTGAGAFSLARQVPAAAGPLGLIAADLDGDGDRDLVTWNQAALPSPWGAFVLLNQGGGSFAAPANYNPGVLPKGAAAGDLDGDGDTDLVFIGFSSSLTALLNNGNGTFASFVSLGGPGGVGVSGVTTADVDGDGDNDLAVSSAFTYDVCILFNDGSGTFPSLASYPVSGMPAGVVAADLDGDGDADLVTANSSPANCTVLLNNGAGAFAAGPTLDAAGSIAVADLDRDGRLDLALGAGQLRVFLGTGGGSFDGGSAFPAGLGPGSPVAADLDGDGRPDVAVTNSSQDAISVLANRLVAFSRDCNANRVPDECEADADQDRVPDVCDLCPGADDLLDTDADGTPDCLDLCALDPHKTAPGTCGCALPDLPDCSLSASAWPTQQHDLRRTARSPILASQSGLPLYAARSAGGFSDQVGGTPSEAAVGAYGVVYYSNGLGIVAVDPVDGTLEWTSPTVTSAPALAPDGTIHGTRRVGGGTTDPGILYALHPWGAVKWSLPTSLPSLGFSGLAVGPDGTVYGGYTGVTQQAPLTYVARRFAVSAGGALLWEHTGSATWGSMPPAIGPDGALYMVGDGKVMKVDASTGAPIWSAAPSTGALSRLLIADNGLVVVTSGGNLPNGVHALDPATGNEAWMVDFDDQTYGYATAPFLLHTGEIGAIWEGKIYRLDPGRGRPKRTVPFPGVVRSVGGVAVGADNTVYLWHDHRVKAVSPFTGELKFAWAAVPGGECLNAYAPTILRDGSLFTGWHRRTYCEDYSGSNHYVTLAPPVPVGAPAPFPRDLAVRVAPSPSRGEVGFLLDLPEPGYCRLAIFDPSGRRVASLLDRALPAGRHAFRWRREHEQLRPGVYFYRLTLGSYERRGTVVLLP